MIKRRCNGKRPPKIGKTIWVDDSFSRELVRQGDMGKWMRMLYLQQEIVTYQKRVLDEPLYF